MVWFALVAALVFGMLHSGVGLPHLASAAPAGPVPAAETSMAQGWSAHRRGQRGKLHDQQRTAI